MKKRNYAAIFIFTALSMFTLTGVAQGFKEVDKVPHDISYYRESRIAAPLVKVLYGRPSKENQQIFGDIVPYGEIWRTGYNEATEIKFYQDVEFGGKKVPAGTYVLLTVPGKTSWKIILNSQLDTWGAFQYDPLFNIAEITVPVTKAESLETFSIAFKNRNNALEMVLGWDATRVKIPLQFVQGKSSLAHRHAN